MPLITDSSTWKSTDPRVNSHQLTFVMELLGAAAEGTKASFEALSKGDAALQANLLRLIPGSTFVDHYEIECERLDIFQPEFSAEKDLPAGRRFYGITLGASREIPFLEADKTDSFPLSVERLVGAVPHLIEGIYAKEGVDMQYAHTTFHKTFSQTQSGRCHQP